MSNKTVDRITEGLIVLCIAGAVVILGGVSNTHHADIALAGLRPQEVSRQDQERFRLMIREVRRKVDGNGDPGPSLARLVEGYPGRHEVWVVDARYLESAGRDGAALVSYARAVRLEPDYLDEGSELYLGRRIGEVLNRTMGDLLRAREHGLDEQQRIELDAAYFLERRLAGGCE